MQVSDLALATAGVLGSARVSRAGFGVPPKRSFQTARR
jgi:hypothetical protein